MRFTLFSVVAGLSATAAAQLPSTCKLDSFYALRGDFGATYTCKWYVCGQHNSWRLVRDCGVGNGCKNDQPTTCLDHAGNPY